MRWAAFAFIGLSLCGVNTVAKSEIYGTMPPLPGYVQGFDRADADKSGRGIKRLATGSHAVDAHSATKQQLPAQMIRPSTETYRGYFFELSAITDQKDFPAVVKGLRQQIDIVENVGLSRRVREFFRTVPIIVDEFACMNVAKSAANPEPGEKPTLAAACYGPFSPDRLASKPHGGSVWDHQNWRWSNSDPIAQAEDNHLGMVYVRTRTLDPQRPVLLHEMLHAYHANIVPRGVRNAAIKSYYDAAKSGKLYPADAYLLTNEREFFAVTASVFLYGSDGPFTRSMLEQQQPDYYKYLVWLFGFEPVDAPNGVEQQVSQNAGWSTMP
jgi:hypothetical protein